MAEKSVSSISGTDLADAPVMMLDAIVARRIPTPALVNIMVSRLMLLLFVILNSRRSLMLYAELTLCFTNTGLQVLFSAFELNQINRVRVASFLRECYSCECIV